MKIGFVGLGAMGRPMAEWLIAENHDISVADANAALASDFGDRWAATPAAAAEGADILVTMLPNGQIVRDVLWGAGGAADALPQGAIVVDMSSSDAAGTVALGAELAARGIGLIDAPVSGGVVLAGQGKLSLMVGGTDDAAFERVRPLLEALSAKLLRVGPLGAGHAAKAINNAIAACNFAIMAEGLELGARFGLDRAVLLEVVNGSTGRSGVSEGLFPSQVLTGKYGLGFALALMTKDVGLADRLRKDLHLELPLLEKTVECYREALRVRGNAADFTEYHRFVEESAGVA
jgi:3-hydroxyisobutyrate dehydrogenase